MNKISSIKISIRIWLTSALVLSTGIFVYALIAKGASDFLILFGSLIATTTGSIPAFIILIILLPLILRALKNYTQRITTLILLFLFIAIVYGVIGGLLYSYLFDGYSSLDSFYTAASISSGSIFASVAIAFIINLKYVNIYFLSTNKNITIMEENFSRPLAQTNQTSQSNKILIKGLMTAGLILLMLIPTVFVSNLVEERQERQQEVKDEVSSKWAGRQDITFPYLFIPYNSL